MLEDALHHLTAGGRLCGLRLMAIAVAVPPALLAAIALFLALEPCR